jgi:hypothetical protein
MADLYKLKIKFRLNDEAISLAVERNSLMDEEYNLQAVV